MQLERLNLAIEDIVSAIKHWRIWLLLGWQDIRLRYRRSQLGPFWITISMAVMIYSMGFLYGHLFKANLSHYFPYVAGGILTWSMISTIILESNDAFMEAQNFIKQTKLPYYIYIFRVVWRNFIVFLHNSIAVVPIIIYFHVHFGILQFLSLCFGLAVIIISGLTYGMVLGMIGVRFRDVKQIINSLIQVIFLLTPVMWMPTMLPERYGFIAHFNPFNQIISLVRTPLIGQLPTEMNLVCGLVVIFFGASLMFLLLCCTRHRIAFWL